MCSLVHQQSTLFSPPLDPSPGVPIGLYHVGTEYQDEVEDGPEEEDEGEDEDDINEEDPQDELVEETPSLVTILESGPINGRIHVWGVKYENGQSAKVTQCLLLEHPLALSVICKRGLHT